VNNYLLGKDPPRLDVLQWDNDPTRLPAALHSDFLDMYAYDVFRRPGALRVRGFPIDFRKIRLVSYVVGGEDDTMMPWGGCFQACQVFRGRHTFVLSTSGHVQSILRPPRVANKHYYTGAMRRCSPETWRRDATRIEGSWWGHWHAWLNANSGALKRAPTRLGSPAHPPLMPAPGSYVLE
ncbi:MAG: class II poly(R)-hydroxyalkanoic acid synthase, partial [Alphaproteobacteria bacterium]|nr:class II poly(R)-hydroxyalkanoic acid synthase [Alphaproteobacteria bacterium]